MGDSTVQRIAVFGGVYSNHLALEAALDDARRRGAGAVFCLGDLGAFGPHPDRVFPLLIENQVRVVRGNYDDSIGRGLTHCQCGYTDPRDNYFAALSYDYTLSKTSPRWRSWLAALPESIRMEFGHRRLLMCHGSPRRTNEFLWESTTSTSFLEKLTRDFDADVILASHTGVKWRRTLGGAGQFVNVGVLGRPENDGSTDVWYTILTLDGPDVHVEFIRVAYDHERFAFEMREERLAEEFVSTVLTGWWTTCLEILPAKERLRGRF